MLVAQGGGDFFNGLRLKKGVNSIKRSDKSLLSSVGTFEPFSRASNNLPNFVQILPFCKFNSRVTLQLYRLRPFNVMFH
jgi:hypothetical protein